MPSKLRVVSYTGLAATLLFLTDRRLHVVQFLLPVLLFVGSLISLCYFMELRNWSLPLISRIGKQQRRVSDAETSAGVALGGNPVQHKTPPVKQRTFEANV